MQVAYSQPALGASRSYPSLLYRTFAQAKGDKRRAAHHELHCLPYTPQSAIFMYSDIVVKPEREARSLDIRSGFCGSLPQREHSRRVEGSTEN